LLKISYYLAVQTQTDIVTRINIWLSLVFSLLYVSVFGQVGVAYDLDKPAKYENRTLASEKSTEGKFKAVRHEFQNTITHYNFFFNANNKLNEVIARAKALNRDDYTKLLPFYNYSLDATALQKKELDSVIFKCTTGILIHDTRNDWIDNLYLLMGESYFFRKTFDSAYITLQFLNFAFAPKEKDGYDKPIGSNANADEGGNANIVSTREKPNIAQKIFSLPPSRNDGLVWQIRNYLELEKYPEAAALIDVLKHDPLFPHRLSATLEEVQALLFYKESIYDSAAYHLAKALPAAANNEEQARWEYLIGQLHERSNDPFLAKTFYERTIKHTYNPVLEVYARLNAIRQNRDSSTDYVQKNIDALVKMGKKDRYESYRDIIYYTAAEIELERNNKPGAEIFLLKCVRSEGGDGGQRNKAFLKLADLSFEKRKYKAAKNYYDSVNIINLSAEDRSFLHDRKIALANIVAEILVIERQDSLQRIAALPANEREAYVKKLARALRRLQGLHDDDQSAEENNNNPSFGNNSKAPPPDLFSSSSGNAEWYFYNPTLKSNGFSAFKTKWGNRPNVDNWQLSSLISLQRLAVKPGTERTANALPGLGDKNAGPSVISFKSLMDNLPLTPEKMKKSSDSVETAMFKLGKVFQEDLPDYNSAIYTYDSLLRRMPATPLREEILFNLYYCYTKIGDQAKADSVLQLMKSGYPGGKFTATAINPDSAAQAPGKIRASATRQYDKIYTAFIEGRFDEALAEKKEADSLYGSTYWTPQLLYIEAVYLIHSRQDPQAKTVLGNIQTKFPGDPMAAKAARLVDVLNRRRQIETYLTNLKIERANDTIDLAARADSVDLHPQPGARTVVAPKRFLLPRDSTQKNRTDTSQSAAKLARIKADADQAALLRKRSDSLQIVMKKATADSLALTRSRKASDSTRLTALKHHSDSIRNAIQKLQADTAQLANHIRAMNSVFAYTPEKPHSVVLLMTKVDPVYVTEARNAFNRYDLENYYGKSLAINNVSLNDTVKLMVIDSFENSMAALDYLAKAKAFAPKQIVPWLPVANYSFLVISEANLELLIRSKDMEAYRKFLIAVYPGKF
jgi:hypothetical protein